MGTKILVITDHRLGNSNQALALASKLSVSYEVKKVSYNYLAKLPNFLLRFFPFHIKSTDLKSFDNDSLPDLIISSGRRLASFALYLKKKSGNKLKIVQIMSPDTNLTDFDLVILPQHDSFDNAGSNIFRVVGALSNIEAKAAEAEEALRVYPEIKNTISVVVGGDTKNYHFSEEDAKIFVSILLDISINHSSYFFITFSRRTSDSVKKIIKQSFPKPHTIHDPQDGGVNPYSAMLSFSNYIISTADSISMCSEIASTGKPIYIYCPNSFKLKKHRLFIQQLFDLEIARKLDQSVQVLEQYQYQPLSETKKVAELVKSKFLI